MVWTFGDDHTLLVTPLAVVSSTAYLLYNEDLVFTCVAAVNARGDSRWKARKAVGVREDSRAKPQKDRGNS